MRMRRFQDFGRDRLSVDDQGHARWWRQGMRIAWKEGTRSEGFRIPRNEAASSFGDDRIFISRNFVTSRAHIEIQFCWQTAMATRLSWASGMLDQRRNQKVIEERQAPFLDARPAGDGQQGLCAAASDWLYLGRDGNSS